MATFVAVMLHSNLQTQNGITKLQGKIMFNYSDVLLVSMKHASFHSCKFYKIN